MDGRRGAASLASGSAGSATVGVKITGYSTQIPAGGVSGTGGTNGQVLVAIITVVTYAGSPVANVRINRAGDVAAVVNSDFFLTGVC